MAVSSIVMIFARQSCTALAALFPCSESTLEGSWLGMCWLPDSTNIMSLGTEGEASWGTRHLWHGQRSLPSLGLEQQPSTTSPLNLSCSCLNSEISFTLSLALLTCVAFGVIREKILCPFTITGFWNIKMSLCIGSVILIGILTFD